ncbi:MAG: L,D-transpeptidase family protein [Gallionella sp.]|nr:L,D-transpeptidase family protein [Gallionella sp.]
MQTKIIVAIFFAGAVGVSSQAAELPSPDTPSPAQAAELPSPDTPSPSQAAELRSPDTPSSPQVAELLSPDTLSETERVGSVEAEMKGALVLRGQVLLDRAHFSSGEIDAAYGQNLRMAIQGYQKSQGLTVTGNIDAPTWEVLNVDAAPILQSYTILQADVDGPYVAIRKTWAGKAKMAALGYESVEEALAERFHVSPTLLKQLNPDKVMSRVGEVIVVPNIATNELPKAEKVIIDGSNSTLALVDADGKIIAQFPVTKGSKHDPLPRGKWKVTGVMHNPVFHYNPKLFWDAKPKDTKVTIPAGPNNPVGVVWVAFSKAHYGIHGTSEPSTIGKTQSHGCIRLTNWDATTLAQSVVTGVIVLIQK